LFANVNIYSFLHPALWFNQQGRNERARGQKFARIRTGSGLKPILAGSGLDRTAIFLKIGRSGLDRTEKIFVVLMWLF